METPPKWLVDWAPIIAPVGTLLLAVVAMRTATIASRTAKAASTSADMAQKEFQTARRPFPYIKWDRAQLKTSDARDDRIPEQAALVVYGRVHEASHVPTTLHELRMCVRVGAQEIAHKKEPCGFQEFPVQAGSCSQDHPATARHGALLFGEHVYYTLHEVPVTLTIDRAEYDEFAERGTPIMLVETELVVSGPEQPRETWHIDVALTDSKPLEDGNILTVRQYPPSRAHDSDRPDCEPLAPHAWST